MTEYSKWEDVPDTLATKTQLSKLGLKPAKDQKPAAIKRGWKSYPDYDLYEIALAIPRRKLSEAQAAALEAARRKAMTTICCNRYVGIINWRERGDMCASCWYAEQERQHQEFLKEAKWEASEWAREVLADPAAVILDTETTGLSGSIVDVAIITTQGNVLLDTLINPERTIPEDASAIHGITDEMVKDAPTFQAIYPELLRILTKARVVIYNAEFDTGRLWYDCQRCDLPQLEKSFGSVECAMYRYAAWYGDWSDYHGSFRWQRLNGGHRALGDCQATLERIKTMAK